MVAVLERHEALWIDGLLRSESARRAPKPEDRLAALIDVFHEWLQDEGYAGCLFINSVLEVHDRSTAIREASLVAIAHVYELLWRLGQEAGLAEGPTLAHQLQLLFRGSIVAAREGNFVAVNEGRMLALRLIEEHRAT